MGEYPINIFHSAEDGGSIADLPDLGHCSAFGLTPEEALRELQIAKAAWLSVAEEKGLPIPAAKSRPSLDRIA